MYEFWQHRFADVSSSAFGQYVHERLPVDFDAMDIDLVVRAESTGILRVLEQKEKGQRLKPSQWRCLRRIAALIELGEKSGVLTAGSGVYRIDWSDSEIMKALRGQLPIRPERVQIAANGILTPLPDVANLREFNTWLRCRV